MAARHICAFAPADRHWRRRSGSGGVRAVSAARAAPWGRLENVQKVLTDRAPGTSSGHELRTEAPEPRRGVRSGRAASAGSSEPHCCSSRPYGVERAPLASFEIAVNRLKAELSVP